MAEFQLLPGDILTLSVERPTTRRNPETNEQETVMMTHPSLVRVQCPESMWITGGEVNPEWLEDRRELVFRLKTR